MDAKRANSAAKIANVASEKFKAGHWNEGIRNYEKVGVLEMRFRHQTSSVIELFKVGAVLEIQLHTSTASEIRLNSILFFNQKEFVDMNEDGEKHEEVSRIVTIKWCSWETAWIK